ncbi:MAG: metalloregulator ArsR/SmtB family transcription factor [Armatimonadota bacterium]|nr:metalloregulator ArsR/SmtB family transcription factor [Armatimonadota bacterium]
MRAQGVLDLRGLEAVLKGLAHRRRLRMLAVLSRHGEMPVGMLADTLRLPVKTVSRNLRILERAGLTISEPRGSFVYYSLRADAPEFARAVIACVKAR